MQATDEPRGMWPGVPISHIVLGATYREPRMSPNGEYLAFVGPDGLRVTNLVTPFAF